MKEKIMPFFISVILIFIIICFVIGLNNNKDSSNELSHEDSIQIQNSTNSTINENDKPTYTESSCDVTSTEAEIKARDFAKTVVKSPSDLEFIDGSVDISDQNVFHVVESVKTMNGLGNMVPAKISIRMKYISGDWTDDGSWNVISIRILNEATGSEE